MAKSLLFNGSFFVDSCIDNKKLELYSLGAALDYSLIKKIEAHIKKCEVCSRYIEEFKSLYEEIEKVPLEVIESATARIFNKVKTERTSQIIILTPILLEKNKQKNYLLAAEGERSKKYMNIQSYANVEEDVVARMIRDNESNEVVLYLLSEDKNQFRDYIVEVEGIPEKFIPDKENRIKFFDLEMDNFESRKLYLKSPLATFDLEPISDLKESILVQGQFQIKSGNYDQIQIEVEEEGGKKLYKIRVVKLKGDPDTQEVNVVVSQTGDKVLSSTAHRGVAVFEEMDLEKVLKIRIY